MESPRWMVAPLSAQTDLVREVRNFQHCSPYLPVVASHQQIHTTDREVRSRIETYTDGGIPQSPTRFHQLS
jgi:hypothetical protein